MVQLALLDRNKDSSNSRLNRNQQPLPSHQETLLCRVKPPRHLMDARRFACVDPYRQEFDLLQLDDNYLLYLCQKNDWRNVERLCDVIGKVLQDNDSSSEGKLLKVKRARNHLQTVDQWGNAALHLVCYHKPPTYVVSALLMACKLLARTRSWWNNYNHYNDDDPNSNEKDHHDFVLYPNHHGATPLMIACRSGACQAVLQLLMQDDSRALLPRDHQAIYCADEEGNTVFSGLVQRYSMLCKVPHYKRYCTSLYARANTATNNHDNEEEEEEEKDQEGAAGPLEITFDGIQFELSSSHNRTPWDEHSQAPSDIKGSSLVPTSTITPGEAWLNPSILLRGHKRNKNAPQIFPELWENIFMLLDAAWKDSLDELGNGLKELLKSKRYNNHNDEDKDGLASSPWCDYPIHATALVADALPPSIMDLLLRLFHEDWIKRKEDDAVHPIHFAVIRDEKAMIYGSPLRHQEEAPCHSHWTRLVATMKRRSHLLERFMAVDPGSARLVMPHSKNRLVFHQAIASGWTWHIRSASTDSEPGPLQILFRAAPELLTQRDGETGLYPFQLAAAATAAVELSSSSSSLSSDYYYYYHHHHQEPQQQLQVLDTIFQLLRKAPEVLTHVE